jgi:phage-related protein
MKELYWVGTSKQDLIAFPDNAKQEAGYQLSRVQEGKEPTDWKPMKTVGQGCQEIRIKDARGIYRVFYVVIKDDGVYVLHAFQKRTQKTEKKDITKAKRRYNEVMRQK